MYVDCAYAKMWPMLLSVCFMDLVWTCPYRLSTKFTHKICNIPHKLLHFHWTLIPHLRRNFFPMELQPPLDQDLLIIETSRSHSDTPQSWDFRGWMIRPARRPLTDNIQQSQETYIHALGGIRTCNPIKRASTDPRHWDPLKEWILERNGILLLCCLYL